MIDYGRLRTDLLALAVLALSVFLGLSLVSYDPSDLPSPVVYPAHSVPMNLCGFAGAQLAHRLVVAVGAGSYFVLIALIVLDIRLFARDVYKDPVIRLCGTCLIIVTACVTAQWYMPVRVSGSMTGNGGYVGAWVGILLDQNFSRVGSLILLATATVSGVLLTGEQHLARTAFCFSILPITMWSRLAFGKRTLADTPVRISMPTESSNQLPDIPLETLEIEVPSDDPALAPDLPVSMFRVNPPPLLVPCPPLSPPVPQIVVNGSHLSSETVAAIASFLAPQIQVQELEIAVPALEPQVAPKSEEVATAANSEIATIEPPAPAVDVPVQPQTPTSFSLSPERSPIRVNPPLGMNAVAAEARSVPATATRVPYRLPDTSILEDAEAFPYDLLASKARVAAATLEKTFQEFGLNVKVVEIDTGPVITQFELELEKGLRLSKVTSLADDLAIALRVSSVRVIAPIPGKNTVGVEVPNDVRVMVRLKELIDSCRADVESKAIPMFLGKDASGKPLVIDMCKMPHLLIAGRTGTGKSVCLNTLIVSILMTRSPDQVKMLMIDPKMVELSPYSRIPHLMHPVITDMKKAEAVLGWAVEKMEERYQLLSAVGVRHVDNYNQLGRAKILKKLGLDPDTDEAALIPETMPYIVIVADEMADMMMTSGKDVEGHIIRLAQKSRAVGIHLVLATQKPTVDVITGLIKSNLPARISFQVASRIGGVYRALAR